MISTISLLAHINTNGLSQMSPGKLAALADLLLRCNFIGVPGDLVECGVWRGASAALIGKHFENKRKLHLYDSFAGMPAPTGPDITGNDKSVPGRVAGDGGTFGAGSLADTSVDQVIALMKFAGIHNYMIHPGFIRNEMSFHAAPEKIALLHVDLDFYEPYAVTLNALYDRVSDGGLIVFDDYGHFIGAKRAVDEFIARTGNTLRAWDETSRRFVIKGE